jgi:PAS domain S-box-containing protein
MSTRPGIRGAPRILLPCFLLFWFAFSAFPQTNNPQSIRVVIDKNYPPFAFVDEKGILRGKSIDLWRLWEKHTGIHVKIVALNWGEALERMRAGEFDVIDTIFDTPSRSAYLDFSEPYAQVNVPIFFRHNIPAITDLSSLAGGFAVGYKTGDAAQELLEAAGVKALVPFPSYEAVIRAAGQGGINVFVVDEPPAVYYLNKLRIADQFRQSKAINIGQFHRAVRKGHTELLKRIEDGFAALTPAELRGVEERWYGRPVGVTPMMHYFGYFLGGAAVVILGLGAWSLTLRKRVGHRSVALQETESRLRALLDHIPDWVWLKDTDSKYVTANVPYARAINCSPETLPGRKDADIWPAGEAKQLAANDQAVIKSGQPRRVTNRITDNGGNVRWLETVEAPVRAASGATIGVVGIARDVTERRQAETELRDINRTLRMIGECNQVLVRATDETSLLQAICRLVVEDGGYLMAWAGFTEQDEAKSVRPVASAGLEQGYLEAANISWADTERGRGPVGTAIRTGEVVVARNLLTDPSFAPWREAAVERGYAALAAFPLRRDQRIIGSLAVYSAESDTFDPSEVELLHQLADDLAYGITALRTRAQQQRVEEELHLLSARLLQVRDQEQRRLARELHDTSAQNLAALSLNLTNLKSHLDSESPQVSALCSSCIELANHAALEIRTHSYLLHPPLLEALGLAGAVGDYAQGFSARSGIATNVDVTPGFGRLPEDMELALFRIVQESLTNILKHSRSPQAEIRFTRDASVVTLEVQDAGRGIPPDVMARIRGRRSGAGVGFGGMQERLRLLGGRLHVHSDSSGTLIRAVVPLTQSPPQPSPGV